MLWPCELKYQKKNARPGRRSFACVRARARALLSSPILREIKLQRGKAKNKLPEKSRRTTLKSRFPLEKKIIGIVRRERERNYFSLRGWSRNSNIILKAPSLKIRSMIVWLQPWETFSLSLLTVRNQSRRDRPSHYSCHRFKSITQKTEECKIVTFPGQPWRTHGKRNEYQASEVRMVKRTKNTARVNLVFQCHVSSMPARRFGIIETSVQCPLLGMAILFFPLSLSSISMSTTRQSNHCPVASARTQRRKFTEKSN